MKPLLALGTSAIALGAAGGASATPGTYSFSYTGAAFQTLTLLGNARPAYFEIVAAGAEGGSASSTYGGYGAKVGGKFLFLANQTLTIAVGGQGTYVPGGSAGGGGGTFVTIGGQSSTLKSLLVVAGGGGGVGAAATTQAGGYGSGGTSINTGSYGSGSSTSALGGYHPNGFFGAGGEVGVAGYGAGGGGLYGYGGNDISGPPGNYKGGLGGYSMTHGLTGGSTYGCSGGSGGFGGGGAGGCGAGAGGGGGFSGGGSGVLGGGGGSYVAYGNLTKYSAIVGGGTYTDAGRERGAGYFTLTFESYATPEPASIALFGMGVAAIGLLRRRRGLLQTV